MTGLSYFGIDCKLCRLLVFDVRSSKSTLSVFGSLVADAETVLNDRPLYLEFLSPAHLIYGRPLNTLHYNEVINMTRNPNQHIVNIPTS